MTEEHPVRLFIVGLGSRGKVYSRYCLENPKLSIVVGIAEPRQRVVELFKNEYSSTLREDLILNDWKQLKGWNEKELQEKFVSQVDAVVICIQDKLHYEACLFFANLKCNVLLEKPMALTIEECHGIYEAVQRNNIMFAVCHVMRYSECTQKVKSILKENGVGKVIHVQHLEPVGYYV